MISVRNVYKRYHGHNRGRWVLKDINLEIPTRVSVGLIGANGAGKTTLIRLISGMDWPDRGEIVRDCSISWPIGLGGAFQGAMTGRQNVKFAARVHGREEDIPGIIEYVEDFAELGRSFDEPVATYSNGMRARLNFGMSLAFEFDVYLSDEATSVGDRVFRQKAEREFRGRLSGSSLIIVSHQESVLRDFCQVGVVLMEGHAHWFDSVSEAIDFYHDSIEKTDQQLKKAK